MFGSLKNAYELTKELTALQVSTEFKSKISELLEALREAREDALASQEERTTLLGEIRQLKEQAAKREVWLTEKQKYELRRLYPSAVGYMLKPSARANEPPHALCAQCFNDEKKGFLQPTDGKLMSRMMMEHRCSSCGGKVGFQEGAVENAWNKPAGTED